MQRFKRNVGTEVRDKRRATIKKKPLVEVELSKSTHRGQLPNVLVVSQVPELDLNESLFGGIKSEGGFLVKGIFGDVFPWVDEREHLAQLSYMIDHLEKHGKRPWFVLVVLNKPDDYKKVRAIEKKLRETDKRLSSIEWIYGYYEQGEIIIVPEGRNLADFLSDWLYKNKRAREIEGDIELRVNSSQSLVVSCCDARAYLGGNERRIKILGALLSREDRKKLIEYVERNSIKEVELQMHTGCGFITAAFDLYRALELSEGVVRERILKSLERFVKEGEIGDVEVLRDGEVSSPLLHELFVQKNLLLWNVVNRMFDVGLFQIEEKDGEVRLKGLGVSSYVNVKEYVEFAGEEVDDKTFVYLLTEELARIHAKALKKTIEERGLRVKVKISMLSFATYNVYRIPPEIGLYERKRSLAEDLNTEHSLEYILGEKNERS